MKRGRLLEALIFTAVALCFLGTLRNQFVWDDWAFLVKNVGFRGLDARHLRWMLTTTHMASYAPLAWLSYGLDYSIWRMNPVGYHLTNLLLHALNAVLFYRLAALLLRSIFPNGEPRAIGVGAAFAALAFAVHPLRVESVAWASERRDVLSGAFYLSTILLYAMAAARRDARERFRLMAVSIACFACAALSKASVVPLPAALLALDYYPLNRIGAAARPLENRRRLVEKLPYVLIAAAAAVMAVRAQLASGNLTAVAGHGASSRLAQALYGAGFYVWKTIIPTGLYALYPLPEHRGLLALPALIGAAVILAVAFSCGAAGVGRKAQTSLWGYYLALFLPVSGLMHNGPQLVALRYSYLPCLGWALLAGCAAVSAMQYRAKNIVRGSAILGILSLWIAANAWAAQTQIALWRSDRTLWESVVSRYPLSAYANMGLADGLLQERRPREAEPYARIAARLEPDNRTAILALAKTLSEENRLREAQEALEGKLQADSDWGEGQELLGVILGREGRDSEALPRLQRAAALLPSSAEAQSNAGSMLALHGRYAEALPYFENAARIDPSNPSYAGRLEHVRRDLEKSP